jgi:hypothetical protein
VVVFRGCEDKVYEIARAHQDHKGLWIKDPKQRSTMNKQRLQKQL